MLNKAQATLFIMVVLFLLRNAGQDSPIEPDTDMSRLLRGRINPRHNSRHNATGHPATGQFMPLYDKFRGRTETSSLGSDGSFNETHFQASVLKPHPFLAPQSLQLIYDLRLLPATVSFPPTSPYSHGGHQQLSVPMHAGNPRRVRLISPDFPWSFDLDLSSQGSVDAGNSRINPGINGWENPEPRTITCLDILTSLHVALQQPLTDVEWGAGDGKRRESILRARSRRLRLAQRTAAYPPQAQITQGPSSSSSRSSSSSGSSSSSIRVTRARNHSVLRVDWLGSKVLFGGLVRDDWFARSRLFPGTTEEPPETWVVKFRKL
ncbi:hypothetical protein PAXINDRAFT_157184 [Paxillus involutus ATCC 200175]|uniref:DUF6699 domain-containing protein n=1 Tax=Paxillus involutus ATCC 200175 TaxID=664439 RepID=A0A0C9T7Z7_PAXIN|nr:hypothetical protein PAXINDRAFT_157184 [Paxillus involutus ATCC 200175]